MSEFVSLTIDDSQLQAALQRLEYAGVDLTTAMRKIAQALMLETERNFEADGRPKWTPLARATLEGRVDSLARGSKSGYRKDGRISKTVANQAASFRILQHSGQLAASVTSDYDSTQAVIGSNKVYAAIHQFGGMAGRGRKVEIPARPYLPFTTDGELQPEASEEVLDTILRHLKRAAGI